MQAEHNSHPFAKKLAVDPYMRVIGAEDVIGIGDATKMVGSPLPATAQVGWEGLSSQRTAPCYARRFSLHGGRLVAGQEYEGSLRLP